MKEAIRQAKKAYALGEVPIGCVIVYQDKIIGRGYNRRNTDKNTLSHAELIAIKRASKKLGDWRLEECTLYVTVEPCTMCAGAIGWSQLGRVVYGASDAKRGYAVVTARSPFHPKATVTAGVLADECSALMRDFFSRRR